MSTINYDTANLGHFHIVTDFDKNLYGPKLWVGLGKGGKSHMVTDAGGEDDKRRESRRLMSYQMRKAGHDHEWVLLSSRMSTYLTSQSLFATGAALLYGNGKWWSVLFISLVGFSVSFVSSLSITINCRVLRDWHIFMQSLFAEDKGDKFLDGFYIPRNQPDFFHLMSTDVYNVGLPFIGGSAWMFIIDTLIIFATSIPSSVKALFLSASLIVLLGWVASIWFLFSRSLLRRSR